MPMLTVFLIFDFQDPLSLENCVICCEQDWDDCFEVQEFVNKEAFVFKVSTFKGKYGTVIGITKPPPIEGAWSVLLHRCLRQTWTDH